MSTVTMTLKEAEAGHRALTTMSNGRDERGRPNVRLGLELGFAVDDIIDAIEKNAERYHKERNKYLEEHGDLIQGTNPPQYNVREDEVEEFNQKVEDLDETKVKISFEPLTFELLEREGVRLTGLEMRALKKHFIARKKEAIKTDEKAPKKKKEKAPEEEMAVAE